MGNEHAGSLIACLKEAVTGLNKLPVGIGDSSHRCQQDDKEKIFR